MTDSNHQPADPPDPRDVRNKNPYAQFLRDRSLIGINADNLTKVVAKARRKKNRRKKK